MAIIRSLPSSTAASQLIPKMEPWVTGRQQDVPPNYRNTTHGTFVGGLICWGAQLNPHLAASIDPHPCGIFDMQVIPNLDPDSGETDFLTEQELLQSLSTALSQHANRIKVWNLSLGSDEVCALDQFSPLAEELDKLQERFKVTFVISAGNYEMLPMLDYPRAWPPTRRGPHHESGRQRSWCHRRCDLSYRLSGEWPRPELPVAIFEARGRT